MKKILCLIDALRLGGAERQLIGLTSMLKDKGYEADLAMYHKHNFYADLLQKNNITPVLIPTKNNMFSKLFNVGRFIKKNHYDTVIAYIDGPTKICCLLKISGLKFNLIVSERNTSPSMSNYIKFKFFLYRYADYIVPNSYSQKEFIDRNFPHLKEKTITITNFTDTEYFQPANNQTTKQPNNQTTKRPNNQTTKQPNNQTTKQPNDQTTKQPNDQTTRQPDNQTTILIPARIAKQKNVINLLHAVRKIRFQNLNIRFRWVGDVQAGEEKYQETVISTVKKLDISDIIDFIPASNDIIMEYHKCDIVCLPSLFEGYPNILCEAMSCAKPIICSNVCDNPRIVKNGINGFLFDPVSVEDITKTICKICALSDEERLRIGLTNREFALKHFSKDIFIEKYMNLIGQ